jgi:hypothetical protein
VLREVNGDELHLLFSADTTILICIEVIDKELLVLALAGVLILSLLRLSLTWFLRIITKCRIISSCCLFAHRNKTTGFRVETGGS